MNVIYHHRTRCNGAEGVHIKGIQNALERSGYKIFDISLVKSVSKDKSEECGHCEKKLSIKNKFFSFVCDLTPNFIFKILELLYPFYAIINGFVCIAKNNVFGRSIGFVYDRYAYFCFAMPFLCKVTRTPLVLEINTTCLDDDVREIKFRYLAKKIEKFCFENSTIIVVVSGYLKSIIQKNYNIGHDMIVVAPNAVDPVRFILKKQSKNCPDPVKIAESFSEDKLIIGFVGVFVPWHGLDFLIDVFRELAEHIDSKRFKLGLLLVGDGPVRRNVEEAIINYPVLNDMIFITGMVSHDLIPYYIDIFDIAIMPDSNPFGSPMKIFEYMIMGKPIIAPSYGPIKEVLDDRFNGLLFRPRDKDDCCQKLYSLIDCQKLRIKLGSEAKKKVLEKHTWDVNVENIVNRLHSILASKEN